MHLLKQRKRRSRAGAAKTVSEKLHEQFAPSAVAGGDSDSDDEGPQVADFDENDDDIGRAVGAGLSEIRKRNVQLLDAVDRKYRGQVASRKDVFEEEEGVSGEGDDDEDGSDGDYQPGAFVRLKVPEGSDGQSEESDGSAGSEGESSEDDDDDEEDDFEDQDFSLGDFLGNAPTYSQKLIQDENRQEAVQKGTCVQNQLKMWERLLEMRIKMQSCLVTANALPHEEKFKIFSKNDQFKEASQKVAQTVESTLKNLLELQTTLIASFPETKELSKPGTKRRLKDQKSSGSKQSCLTEYESLLADNFTTYKPYRNDVIQKWHDRTKASAGTKNIHQSLSVVKKIENALLTKDELIRKTQLYRGGYELFEKPSNASTAPTVLKDGTSAEPESVYDGEIFDDSDFYHALLRELIEYKSNTAENPQQIGAKLAELQKLRSKMKKQVDTRASKGRKIRYVVHKKLVNFTAPEPSHAWTEDAKNELFMSLFGGTSADNGGE
uniref:Putative apoptosis antagonizing transcription factor/protein transport protein n=1 Tax=Culex tarsalis TaxID=7177 RepID=A0A1Q3F3V3_CULTA